MKCCDSDNLLDDANDSSEDKQQRNKEKHRRSSTKELDDRQLFIFIHVLRGFYLDGNVGTQKFVSTNCEFILLI